MNFNESGDNSVKIKAIQVTENPLKMLKILFISP